MSLNSKGNQTDKKVSRGKNKANQAEKDSKVKKSFDKARREKKKKSRQRQRKRPDSSPATTGANTVSATTTSGSGQKKKKTRDISKITYYSYNKKGHFASNYTEPKN